MKQPMWTHLGMRGFAAMIVVFYHYAQLLLPELGFGTAIKSLHSAQWFIDAFFVLSGFIMGSLYVDRIASGEVSAWSYYRARFARIYPLHLATLIWMVLILALLGTNIADLAIPALRQVFLVQGWGLTDAYHLNHPSWSLSGELAAYLLLPLIAGLVVRGGLGLWMLGVVALLLLGAFVWLFDVEGVTWERLTLLRALSGFFIGIVLSRCKHLTSLIGRRTLAVLQSGAVILLLLAMLQGASLAVALPLLAAIIFLSWDDRGPLAFVLCRSVFLQLGRWSFGIYMLHIPVVFTGFLFWGVLGLPLSGAASAVTFVFLCTVATIVLSWISLRFFELPLRMWLRPKRLPRQEPEIMQRAVP